MTACDLQRYCDDKKELHLPKLPLQGHPFPQRLFLCSRPVPEVHTRIFDRRRFLSRYVTANNCGSIRYIIKRKFHICSSSKSRFSLVPIFYFSILGKIFPPVGRKFLRSSGRPVFTSEGSCQISPKTENPTVSRIK